jgi:hypothetical protein
MGWGKRPSLQPCHHKLLLMGKIARIWGSLRKPVVGISVVMVNLLGYFQEAYHGFLKAQVWAGKTLRSVNLNKS